MIELNEHTIGVWFVSWKDTDWMAGAWRTPAGPEARYRFRYYKDDKAFDSQDEKSWYDIKAQPGEGPPGTDYLRWRK